ncbi:RNA chaperone Hfq [Aneurinibacillus tyrosinisolvens]|uniref:RNA chaperone Hfq n=1 Tax=Aneurinibacillus tyrosinisolvens TaxID=1443435 RepID=UPI00063FBB14|nr:RNA chaperone Hfq [Aneurinibacillus tyrosinisolvens]
MENIQDTFLNNYRKEKKVVTIFTVNGFQVKGVIKAFDRFVIAIDSFGKQQVIYKHAVSTIVEGTDTSKGKATAKV